MVIEEADFRMESVGDSSHFWDLSVLRTVKSKEGERQELKIAAYGVPLLTCLKIITNYRVEMKHPESMSLATYIADYREAIQRLEELTKGI